jgi:hypothetical protein
VSVLGGQVWPVLREAANAFCPPLEVAEERPGALTVALRRPGGDGALQLRYRSERGLFLRTYHLVVEATVAGTGPTSSGELVRRWRRLVWRRPRPQDGRVWARRLASERFQAAARRLQIERLALAWDPVQASWRVSLQTLSGSLTVTFFPPLATPNPLTRDEAEAFLELLAALAAAAAR